MDSSSSKQPRKELQGPRPTPLKVNKDSHKIKKPPVVPPPHPPPRQPVIIYALSPKVIHVEPNNFMELVQRLTGNPEKLPSSSTSMNALYDGQMSPAAHYATVEKARSPEGRKQQQVADASGVEGMQVDNGYERCFPGILSPGPAALPPIPGNFFSPASDLNLVGLFSPGFYGNMNNYPEGGFMPNPSLFVSPQMTFSPSMSMDIFNNFKDV